jgi:hypothetical protein
MWSAILLEPTFIPLMRSAQLIIMKEMLMMKTSEEKRSIAPTILVHIVTNARERTKFRTLIMKSVLTEFSCINVL